MEILNFYELYIPYGNLSNCFLANEPEESVCGTRGCRGVGHFKGAKFTSHHTSFGCPYTLHNLNRTTTPVIDRLSDNALGEEQSIANRIYKKKIESFKEGTETLFSLVFIEACFSVTVVSTVER